MRITCALFVGVATAMAGVAAQSSQPAPRVNNASSLKLHKLQASQVRFKSLDRPVADRVVIPVDRLPMRELDVRTWEGTETKPARGALEKTRTGANLVLQPNRVYLVNSKVEAAASASLQLSTNRSYLPGFGVVANDTGEVARFQLFVETEDDRLTWNTARNAYATRLLLGLESDDDPALVEAALPQTVLFLNASLKLQTNQIKIAKPNTEGARFVEVWSSSADAPATLTVRSNFGDRKIEIQYDPLTTMRVVELVMSLPLLIMTVVGGLIGSFLSLRTKPAPRWWLRLLEGVFLAVVVNAGISAGITFVVGVSAATVAKAAGSLAVGAVVGYAGVSILDRFTQGPKNQVVAETGS